MFRPPNRRELDGTVQPETCPKSYRSSRSISVSSVKCHREHFYQCQRPLLFHFVAPLCTMRHGQLADQVSNPDGISRRSDRLVQHCVSTQRTFPSPHCPCLTTNRPRDELRSIYFEQCRSIFNPRTAQGWILDTDSITTRPLRKPPRRAHFIDSPTNCLAVSIVRLSSEARLAHLCGLMLWSNSWPCILHQ